MLLMFYYNRYRIPGIFAYSFDQKNLLDTLKNTKKAYISTLNLLISIIYKQPKCFVLIMRMFVVTVSISIYVMIKPSKLCLWKKNLITVKYICIFAINECTETQYRHIHAASVYFWFAYFRGGGVILFLYWEAKSKNYWQEQ